MKLTHILLEDKIDVDTLIKKGYVTVSGEPNPETGKIDTVVYNAPQLKKYISQIADYRSSIKVLMQSTNEDLKKYAEQAYKQLGLATKAIKELEAQIALSK